MTQPTEPKGTKRPTPPGGWPAGGTPVEGWHLCAVCDDNIWPGEHIYDNGDGNVRCAVCEVKSRAGGGEAVNKPTVHSRVTEVTFSALPADNINHDIYSVKVTWRGDDRYAVKRLSQCLGADGTWDYEPSPSNREDDWIAEHRFDYDTACRLAAEACQHITVNGFTVADALRRAGDR